MFTYIYDKIDLILGRKWLKGHMYCDYGASVVCYNSHILEG